MNIKIISKASTVNNFELLVKRVLSEFMLLLKNTNYFSSKLNVTTISIWGHIEELSTGVLTEKIVGENCEYSIDLFINPMNSEKFIAYVIAHEFAHLFFANMLDPIKITGRASDDSASYTAIKRIVDGTTIYGETLEESCADYVASHVISFLNLDDYNNQFADVYSVDKEHIDFIEEFASCFGTSMKTHKYIDSYERKDDTFNVYNRFWYFISTFSFNAIVDSYEYYMGASSFQYLCDSMKEYFDNKQEKYGVIIKSEVQRFKILISNFQH